MRKFMVTRLTTHSGFTVPDRDLVSVIKKDTISQIKDGSRTMTVTQLPPSSCAVVQHAAEGPASLSRKLHRMYSTAASLTAVSTESGLSSSGDAHPHPPSSAHHHRQLTCAEGFLGLQLEDVTMGQSEVHWFRHSTESMPLGLQPTS